MQPQQLGPFRIVRTIGRGGMGAVYEAVHVDTGEVAAVKALLGMLEEEEEMRQRFEAEIETLKRLRHPNIVRIYGFGEEAGMLYYVMEYVDGPSLHQELRNRRHFPWYEVAKIGLDMCSALKHAHDRGVTHRDIKPANILLERSGTTKLSDYGIARLFGGERFTNANAVVGTLEYMAPEQAMANPVGPRSDMYALGAVLYALLVGRPPFVAKTLSELLRRHATVPLEPLRASRLDVPEAFGAVINDLLKIKPEERPGNAYLAGRRIQSLLQAMIGPPEKIVVAIDDRPLPRETTPRPISTPFAGGLEPHAARGMIVENGLIDLGGVSIGGVPNRSPETRSPETPPGVSTTFLSPLPDARGTLGVGFAPLDFGTTHPEEQTGLTDTSRNEPGEKDADSVTQEATRAIANGHDDANDFPRINDDRPKEKTAGRPDAGIHDDAPDDVPDGVHDVPLDPSVSAAVLESYRQVRIPRPGQVSSVDSVSVDPTTHPADPLFSVTATSEPPVIPKRVPLSESPDSFRPNAPWGDREIRHGEVVIEKSDIRRSKDEPVPDIEPFALSLQPEPYSQGPHLPNDVSLPAEHPLDGRVPAALREKTSRRNETTAHGDPIVSAGREHGTLSPEISSGTHESSSLLYRFVPPQPQQPLNPQQGDTQADPIVAQKGDTDVLARKGTSKRAPEIKFAAKFPAEFSTGQFPTRDAFAPDRPVPLTDTSPPSRFVVVGDKEELDFDEPRRHRFPVSLRTVFLISCLFFTWGVIYYLLQPVPPDVLYARIRKEVDDPDAPDLLTSLKRAQDNITSFLDYYPEHHAASEIRSYAEELSLAAKERSFERGSFTKNQYAKLLPVERAYIEAVALSRIDPETAADKLRMIVALYRPDSELLIRARREIEGDANETDANGGDANGELSGEWTERSRDSREKKERLFGSTEDCVVLAQRRLASLEQEIAAINENQLLVLKLRLDDADMLEKIAPRRAGEIRQALIDLYGHRAWAAEVVRRAREGLADGLPDENR
ncbi:MAG TPA: hypothetical protein DEB39_00680 [Planctomycetaceae bacterium]|nr:hypothetical protein [Planctomycetaceae bacterium]